MVIKFNKKITIFISVCIILLVALISSYFLYEKTLYVAPYEKYEGLFELCDDEDDYQKTTVIRCPALINSVRDDGNSECFDLSIITKEKTFSSYTVCENKGDIKWNSNILVDTGEKIPVYMDFMHKSKFLLDDRIYSISISLIPDDEISAILLSVAENDLIVPDIRTQEETDIFEKGYYIRKDLLSIGTSNIDSIIFYWGDINNISIVEDKIDLELKLNILKNDYITNIKTNSLIYIPQDLSKQIFIDTENYEEYLHDIEGPFQIQFLYFADAEKVVNSNLIEFCNSTDENSITKLVCTNSNFNIENMRIEDNINSFIVNVIENADKGYINLDRLVLSFIIKK